MRFVALALFFGLPFTALARTPQTPSRPGSVRISIVNMSSHKRQIVTPGGRVTLPVGKRVDLNARPGCDLRVVSDMDSHIDERVCVGPVALATPFVVR